MTQSCSGICSKFSELIALTIPLVFTALLTELSGVITLYFVGRIDGAKYIGAATLGSMMCNITGYSLMYGMCSALDTLVSQAYGAKSYILTGLYVQRAMVILTVCAIPIVLLWSQTDIVLVNILGIESDTALLACLWARILGMGLWPNLISEALRRWLQNQNIVWPIVVSTVSGTIMNFLLNYFFRYTIKPSLGFEGIAISMAISQWIILFILVASIAMRKYLLTPKILNSEIMSTRGDYSKVSQEVDPEDNFPRIERRIFEDWLHFLRLGVPGATSLFIEWGSFELAAGIAGHMGATSLAVHGIFMSTCGLLYMVPQGIASATGALAGNYLGALKPDDARDMVHLGVIFDFVYGAAMGAFLLLVLRPYWGRIFTNDKEVQSAVYDALPVMFFYLVVDSTKCVTLNILRSTGRPAVTVAGNTLACVVILLPLGWLLGLHLNYGIIGLWAAMSTAWLVATLVYSWLVFTTNWADQCITFSTPAGGDSAAAAAAEGASGAVVGIDIQFDFPGAEPSQGSDRMPKSLNLRLTDGAADLHRDL